MLLLRTKPTNFPSGENFTLYCGSATLVSRRNDCDGRSYKKIFPAGVRRERYSLSGGAEIKRICFSSGDHWYVVNRNGGSAGFNFSAAVLSTGVLDFSFTPYTNIFAAFALVSLSSYE